MPRLVVVGECSRRPAIHPEDGVACRDRSSESVRAPRCSEKLPVEDQVMTRREARSGLDGPVEQLADRHPAGLSVDDRPESCDELREIGLVSVVSMDLPAPCGGSLAGRVRQQLWVFEERVEDIEAET